jgi:hypothetical protein
MVLSIRVHELLSKQSNYNILQQGYKSLIPGNDIPHSKNIYHKNMFKLSEKTIELKQSKKLIKKSEIVIDKVEEDELNESEQNFTESDEENLHINPGDLIEIDNDDKEIDNDNDNVKEIDNDDKEIDNDNDNNNDNDESNKIPEKDLMLDLIKIIEDKNKKVNKGEKEQSVEITGDADVENKLEDQQGGEFKRIKLDQHYNFF